MKKKGSITVFLSLILVLLFSLLLTTLEAARVVGMRRTIVGCGGATPPPADIEMGLAAGR